MKTGNQLPGVTFTSGRGCILRLSIPVLLAHWGLPNTEENRWEVINRVTDTLDDLAGAVRVNLVDEADEEGSADE